MYILTPQKILGSLWGLRKPRKFLVIVCLNFRNFRGNMCAEEKIVVGEGCFLKLNVFSLACISTCVYDCIVHIDKMIKLKLAL